MGLACVRRVAQRHRVVLADVNFPLAQELADRFRAEGLAVSAQACDVAEPSTVRELFAASGPVRTLVHVVGLSPTAQDARLIMEVNLAGAARVADDALPRMARGGAAILISSMAAHSVSPSREVARLLDDPLRGDLMTALEREAGRPLSPQEAYRYSKYGLNRLCRRLAAPWGSRGVRIVSLSPGLIRTPMGDLSYENAPAKYRTLERSPLQREGSLVEICDAVEFLSSDAASFISGVDLLVDGGLTAAMEFGAPDADRAS